MPQKWLSDVFFQALSTKTRSGRGYAPDPAEGAYDAPADPLVGWGGGHPSPYTLTPRRVRHLYLGASVLRSPPDKIPGLIRKKTSYDDDADADDDDDDAKPKTTTTPPPTTTTPPPPTTTQMPYQHLQQYIMSPFQSVAVLAFLYYF